MNDVGHKLLLSVALFSHFSDNSASTKAHVHYKVLYMNFVERLGDQLFQDLKSRFSEYIGFFSTWTISTERKPLCVLLDFLKVITGAIVCIAPITDC
jgi:hypothetical protein